MRSSSNRSSSDSRPRRRRWDGNTPSCSPHRNSARTRRARNASGSSTATVSPPGGRPPRNSTAASSQANAGASLGASSGARTASSRSSPSARAAAACASASPACSPASTVAVPCSGALSRRASSRPQRSISAAGERACAACSSSSASSGQLRCSHRSLARDTAVVPWRRSSRSRSSARAGTRNSPGARSQASRSALVPGGGAPSDPRPTQRSRPISALPIALSPSGTGRWIAAGTPARASTSPSSSRETPPPLIATAISAGAKPSASSREISPATSSSSARSPAPSIRRTAPPAGTRVESGSNSRRSRWPSGSRDRGA